VKRLELRPKADLRQLEERLENRPPLLAPPMTIRLDGLMAGAIGIVAALVKLL